MAYITPPGGMAERPVDAMDDSDILAPEPPAAEVLEAQVKAIENQIAHLTRSNQELE